MKANELRIGNYYRAGLEIKGSREAKLNPMDGNRVIRLAIEHFQVFVNAPMIVEMINPIELTEEWLVKFGFVTDGVTFDREVPFVFHYGYRFSLYNTGNAVDFNRSGWAVRVFQSKQTIEIGRIQHVHQLQNIFFALTNEELNIKMDY